MVGIIAVTFGRFTPQNGQIKVGQVILIHPQTLRLLQQCVTSDVTQALYQPIIAKLTAALLRLPKPVVIGVSGAQGCGKSTLAALLACELRQHQLTAQAVSLDDYYLSKVKRQVLAEQVHPLLAQRGVPGTHDIERALQDAKAVLAGQSVNLPVFDKASDDREADLPAQQLDVLLVEGWCVGVPAQAEVDLLQPVNALEAEQDTAGHYRRYINQQLAGPYAEYWQLLQPLIWLQAPDWGSICRWRERQEQRLWQQRGAGMDDEALARFMLPFQRITQASWQQLPAIAKYIVTLDQAQHPQLTG